MSPRKKSEQKISGGRPTRGGSRVHTRGEGRAGCRENLNCDESATLQPMPEDLCRATGPAESAISAPSSREQEAN